METIDSFEKAEKLGDGGGGKVYKVFKKCAYALKIMKINGDNYENMKNLLNEYEIMNLPNHPNILKTYGVFMSNEEKLPSILIEYCPENLDSRIEEIYFPKRLKELKTGWCYGLLNSFAI